jgi:DNA-binding response OmpR family regulator
MIDAGREHGIRVGILEDDPLICGMLAEILELSGYFPILYRDAWAFLEALTADTVTPSSKGFDVVLLDVLLPGTLEGLEVIGYVRRTRPELPVVVMSALQMRHLQHIRGRFPGVTILHKPFGLGELRACLARSVRGEVGESTLVVAKGNGSLEECRE